MDYLSWLERLHAPKAFGEEVIGSTPIFSTNSERALREIVRPFSLNKKGVARRKSSENRPDTALPLSRVMALT